MPGRLRQALAAQRQPADVRAVLRGAAGERCLAWGRATDRTPVVATHAGLWAYGERLAWVEIDRVVWGDATLDIWAIDGERRSLPLAEDRDLPAVVRAQVDGSVLVSQRIPLQPGGRGATVVGRRRPDGGVLWRMRYDEGVRSDDPQVRSRAEAALAALRAELGI